MPSLPPAGLPPPRKRPYPKSPWPFRPRSACLSAHPPTAEEAAGAEATRHRAGSRHRGAPDDREGPHMSRRAACHFRFQFLLASGGGGSERVARDGWTPWGDSGTDGGLMRSETLVRTVRRGTQFWERAGVRVAALRTEVQRHRRGSAAVCFLGNALCAVACGARYWLNLLAVWGGGTRGGPSPCRTVLLAVAELRG